MSQPCTMYCNYPSTKECGKPAELGWLSETGSIVPVCEDCIAWTKTNRQYLKKLDALSSDTTPNG